MKKILAAVSFAAFAMLAATGAQAAPKNLEFTVMRKGDDIGNHVIAFKQTGKTLEVFIHTRISVKVLFVTAYTFAFDGTEKWQGNKLIGLTAKTNDNGEKHDVSAVTQNGQLLVTADGKTSTQSPDLLATGWWNKAFFTHAQLLDVLDGKIKNISVKSLGAEKVDVDGKQISADHEQVSGDLQRDLWYAKDGTLVRQALHKKGDLIEYVVK